MASGEEKLEDLLSCPVCFEVFTDTGETVPRTLPCTHKLCTRCLKKLLEQVKRECPICRIVLVKDIRKFPQDKFVITYLKEKKQEKREGKREKKREEKGEAKSTCHKHGIGLILFCRDDKVAICPECLIESHNGHNLIGIKEIEREERENLLQRVGTLKSVIAEKKNALEKAKEELVNRADKSVANLQKEIQKITENCNDMIKKIVDAKSAEVNRINSALDTLKDIRVMCESLSDNTGRESRQELLNKIETMGDIERNAAENFSEAQYFKYHEYQAPELTPEARCGRISEGTITADLSKGNLPKHVPRDVPMPEAMPVPIHVPRNVPMAVPRHVGVNYKVKKRIPLDFSTDGRIHVTPLDATSVLVFGGKQNASRLSRLLRGTIKDVYMLARVNVQTGKELVSVNLAGLVDGIATVELGGRRMVALSIGFSEAIVFRDAETLQLITTYSVAPHHPGRLCASSPSILLYAVHYQTPEHVHILDCSGAEPSHVGVIKTKLYCINDMCVWGVKLLVCVGSEIMTAHHLRTGEVKWRVDRTGFEGGFTPFSVTSGGRGHVYTCDDEQNIRTFHVSSGRYLGERQMALDALREQGITRPCNVSWNSDDYSLVVRHGEYVDGAEKDFLSVVRVE